MEFCLITGASKGIGYAMSSICAQENLNLILVARSREMLLEQANKLRETYGIQVEVYVCDLSQAPQVQELLLWIKEKGLYISRLVNNAGLGTCGSFVETEHQRIRTQMLVNMEALTLLIHGILPDMLSRNQGKILNIASTAAFQPGPYMSVYFATKSFVLSLSEGLRYELRDSGITVTTHCPGPTESAFAQEAGNDKTMLFSRGAVATSHDVALHAFRSMEKGKSIAVHGWSNWLGTILVPWVPRWITLRMAAMLNSPKK